MNVKNILILGMAAVIAGLIMGLVLNLAWETVAVIMAASIAVTVLLYLFSPARSLAWVSGTTFFVTLGMYLATVI